MLDRHFFDTSAFLAVIKNEAQKKAVLDLLGNLKQFQLVTSVLVVYELYRGVHPDSSTRKSQIQQLDIALSRFSIKPVHEAHAMLAAKCFHSSKGKIDPILAAQCLDGGFMLVTTNRQDFERVPGIKLYDL